MDLPVKLRTVSEEDFQILSKFNNGFSLQEFLRLCFNEIIRWLEEKQASNFERV